MILFSSLLISLTLSSLCIYLVKKFDRLNYTKMLAIIFNPSYGYLLL